MALTAAQAAGILKQRYPDRKLQFLGYKDNPLLALVPKDPTFDGKVYVCPLHYGGNQGGSHTFAKAQANKTGGLYDAFVLTRVKDYALTSTETEALLASMRKGPAAFLDLAVTEVDNSVRQASHNLNHQLYGNFGGARGQVGSVSTVTLTLKDINDIVNFEEGMKITSSNTDGTSGADDAEAIEITGIDYNAGTLTAGSTWTTNGHFSDNDYLFREGDFGLAISGFDSWFPSSAPSSTAFFGVDRSTNSRLAGQRFSGSGYALDECLLAAESQVYRAGGTVSHIFMNTADHLALRQSLGSKVIYDRAASIDMPKVGFRSVVLVGSAGQEIQVVNDRDCPHGVAYGVEMSSLVLATLGPAPRFLKVEGQDSFIWDYNGDSVEFRSGYYGQLGCYAPNHNIRIALP